MDSTVIDYCENIIYKDRQISYIFHDEGYITLNGSSPLYHYYLKDHQGNIRVVANENKSIEQVNHYYAFGGLLGVSTGGDVQPYKYGGKELDRMHGLDWYDFEARIKDDLRFTTMDPLCEKYYSWSPYVYCMSNPVIFIDPNGKKVYFALGVSNQFKLDFAKSVQHLNKHGAAGMLAKLENSDKVYYIGESSNEYSQYDKGNNTITWASRYGILTTEGITLSATSTLNHEIDHALQHDQNPKQQQKDGKYDSSNPYKNKEEERVIKGSEQKTAKKLGEIKEGEITRKDHSGTLYKMKSSISIEIEDELTIRPQR